ncbi:WD40-like Beta Propeller Repeat family protein [Chlamydia ibidis]|uniref:Protein TolB homolog n=2 Tax=Chlamydia ibidis TaxID=1405396 RepID=S7J330_9CHLA|nr:Tol-Pal system protein TolB [Chlamydia ibidis]EPP34628.1 WD40-like Beta Propeller Repeat family protein [Chlamydia ibidis]EQM63037.1 WD40-like Beta Propeller Repeat family protein [Chlamydia ibidis 10-1398/6]
MLLRIFVSTFLLFSMVVSYAKDLEVVVRAENTLLPVHVVFKHLAGDAKQEAYARSICTVFLRDLALGDRLEPFLVDANVASGERIVTIYCRYPELTFFVSKDNQEPRRLASVILTEDLGENRQSIHQIADQIHLAFTHVLGISSGKIIFSLSKDCSGQELKQGELWSVDYDGKNLHPLTKENTLSITPKWLGVGSDHSYIYVSYRSGIPKIFLGSLQNAQGRKILSLKGNQFMPAFSPRKKLLAFISDAYGNPDLFLQSFSLVSGAKGEPRRILDETFGTQGNPTFSPDGSRIVFVSNKDGVPRLYIMQVDPQIQAPRLLTKKYRNSSCPAWSPDGKKIAFCSVIKGVRQICCYDISTGKDYQLTTTPGDKESPSWAADSSHLVFSSGGAGLSDLYLLSLITQKTRKIAIGSGEKRFPSWGAFLPQPMKGIS